MYICKMEQQLLCLMNPVRLKHRLSLKYSLMFIHCADKHFYLHLFICHHAAGLQQDGCAHDLA